MNQSEQSKAVTQKKTSHQEVLALAASALVDADHLADVAEKMLGALNAVAGAQERMAARGHKSDREALEQAEESRAEYWRAMQSAAYEYRKRAARTKAAMSCFLEDAQSAMKTYAVIGRIPFDDEDTCHIFKASSIEEAMEMFADEMYENDPGEDRERNIKTHGCDLGVYINQILLSDSEIMGV